MTGRSGFVVVGSNSSTVELAANGGRLSLLVAGGCDTLEGLDLEIAMPRLTARTATPDGEKLEWEATSTRWVSKRHTLHSYDWGAIFSTELVGSGKIDCLHFFECVTNGNFVEHNYQLKHFMDRQTTPYSSYRRGSEVSFKSVFLPEPNIYGEQIRSSSERLLRVGLSCTPQQLGGNSAFNPGLMCFTVGSNGAWWAIGPLSNPGEFRYSEWIYAGGTQFGLRLPMYGLFEVERGRLRFDVGICVGTNEIDATSAYAELARSRLSADSIERDSESPKRNPWWRGPIICGFGHQSWKGDLFQIRSKPRRLNFRPWTLCTQEIYERFIDDLDAHELPWRILIIDKEWVADNGSQRVDDGKWPDLRGFIDGLHERGKRVVLWWEPWDTSGFDPELCIAYDPDSPLAQRNGRSELSPNEPSVDCRDNRLAPDISLPVVQEMVEARIALALSADSGCMNADGLKIDHVVGTPTGYGLTFPKQSWRLSGIELLHLWQSVAYKAAKRIKHDALVIGHSPHPYFADCVDMIRIGPLYGPQLESVAREAIFRAKMARISDSHWLIDMDGWPMPSRRALLEYAEVQPQYGVPALYYSTHIDTTGELLTPEDFAHIRRAWCDYLEATSDG